MYYNEIIELSFKKGYPCSGGSSGKLDKKSSTANLKLEKVEINVASAGSLFHNFGPNTEKEVSYNDCTLEFAFTRGGMIAIIPLRSENLN